MKNKLITGIITGLALLVFASGASAIMTAEDLQARKDAKDEKQAELDAKKIEIEEKRDAKKEEIEAKKTEIQDKRCERVRERVQKRIQNFENNNSYHKKNFNSVNKNIEELVELFKADGIDTSDLENYLVILETKLQKLYSDHDAFINSLQASTEINCADIEDGVRTKLQLARKEGEVIKEDVLEIKDYYKNTIRPELLELKKEYLEITETDLTENENEETENEVE